MTVNARPKKKRAAAEPQTAREYRALPAIQEALAQQRREVGERLLKAREQLGLKRRDWQAQYNIGQSRISQWETGVSMPEITLLVRICEDYDLSLDYILRGIVTEMVTRRATRRDKILTK